MSVPSGTNATLLGILGQPVALISAGVVVMAAFDEEFDAGASGLPGQGGPSGSRLRWWVAAGDRWYRPEQEAAVRATTTDGAPVIQTALRVPAGDVRVVSFGAMIEGGAALVSEVHNDSAGPLLFALVSDAASTVGARTRRFRSSRAASPKHLLRCSRVPDDVLSAPSLGALAELLERHTGTPDGVGTESAVHGESSTERGTATAQLFALSAGARLRVVAVPVPVAPLGRSGPTPSTDPGPWTTSVPTASAVAAGWRRQVEQSGRIETPDEVAASRLMADRCHLLIDGRAFHPLVVRGLAAWGHSNAAVERFDAALRGLEAPVDAGLAAQLLEVIAHLLAWSEEPARLALALAETAAELAVWVGPGPARQQAGQMLAQLAAVTVGPNEPRWQPLPPPPWTPEPEAAGSAGGGAAATAPAFAAGCGGSAVAGARRLLARRAELVEEPSLGQLVLLPGWQDSWRGRPLEVHQLPTHLGPLSLALRWHGPRPALLWNLDQRPGNAAGNVPQPVLRCPALDANFSGRGWQGEALLD